MEGEAIFFAFAQLSQRKGTGSGHISGKGRKITEKRGRHSKSSHMPAGYMYIWGTGTLTVNLSVTELPPHIVKPCFLTITKIFREPFIVL